MIRELIIVDEVTNLGVVFNCSGHTNAGYLQCTPSVRRAGMLHKFSKKLQDYANVTWLSAEQHAYIM